MIHHGDLFDVLPTLAECSVDTCVTDPPYGIGFMGKEWDSFSPATAQRKAGLRQCGQLPRAKQTNGNLKGRTVNGVISTSQIEYDRGLEGQRAFQVWTERWAREVFRVLKPGAHLLVCGAPRSFHRMACGVEDAGFEVRDCLSWLYGQGFPKSLNLGDGRGTALKPGWEPVFLARKPVDGTTTANVAQHGTGALNIDACRIGDSKDVPSSGTDAGSVCYGKRGPRTMDMSGFDPNIGRWPANVCLDEDAAEMLDRQAGVLGGAAYSAPSVRRRSAGFSTWKDDYQNGPSNAPNNYGDLGGASRFYYVAKPSREERDFGCEGLQPRSGGEACEDRAEGSAGLNNPRAGAGRTGGSRNFHPTVKPVELMRWLVKLVTPIGGIVLDPFTGSGTTGMACRYEQREFIGIEREAEYVEIAERRIAAVAPLFAEAVV